MSETGKPVSDGDVTKILRDKSQCDKAIKKASKLRNEYDVRLFDEKQQ